MALEVRPLFVVYFLIKSKSISSQMGFMLTNMFLSGPPCRAPIYSDSSTKNMNQHLASHHGVNKEYPDGGLEKSHAASASRIEAAFGRRPAPGIRFNCDILKEMLIRWIYVTNTLFTAVEDPTFRVLLKYLLTCVSSFYIISLQVYVLSINLD